MRSRVRTGSVVQDKRDKVWRFYWWENGKRRSKALGKFPTKVAAWSAAKPLRDDLERGAQPIRANREQPNRTLSGGENANTHRHKALI